MQTNVIRRNIQRSLFASCYLMFLTLSPRSPQHCGLLWCFPLIHYLCRLLTKVLRATTWSNISLIPYRWRTCVRCALWNNPPRYIDILRWLCGLLVNFLYLVWFSLCSSLFWELRDYSLRDKFAILSFEARSHIWILIYRTWAIIDTIVT